MVLKIYGENKAYIYNDIDTSFFRTRSYGGMMYLQFDISTNHELYKYITEETRLEYDHQYYIVKGINERTKAGISTINAELYLRSLDSKVYTSKVFTTKSFYDVSQEILRDTMWTVTNAELVSKRTTLEVTDSTPRQILEQCSNLTVYGTCYEFDTIRQNITLIKPENNTDPNGCYFTDELNLAELTFKGSSASLITKLYAYGKDGLSIAKVNGGKEYIVNHDYTDKDIVAVWRDERYTDAQSLYDDAVVKLRTLAVPERSYTCKVIDLAKLKPDVYGDILKYDLYDVITLIDRNRKTRINHRIVEVKEYPADPTLNTVTLSTITAKISGKITTLDNKLTQLDAQQFKDRTKVNEIKQDLDSTVLHISESAESEENESIITQTANGLFLNVKRLVGKNEWSTLLQQSSNDVQISWNNISNYIKFENSQLNVYRKIDNKTIKIMSLHSGGQDIYDDNGSLLMSLSSYGQRFYYKNNQVGMIGTNNWNKDDNFRGMVFHIKNNSGYMSWSVENSTGTAYESVLCYLNKAKDDNKKGLHLWDKTYTNGNLYLNDNYNLAKLSDGSVAYAGEFFFGTRSTNNSGGYVYTPYSVFSGRNTKFYKGASIEFFNDVSVNFYSNIYMHGYKLYGESDIRLKKNIANTQINGLKVLNSIDLKEFRWLDTVNEGAFVPIGIIAQQLQAVAPELITEEAIPNTPSSVLNIKVTDLVFYCIKAIQELTEELSTKSYTKATYDTTLAGKGIHRYSDNAEPVGVIDESERIKAENLSGPVVIPIDNNIEDATVE